MSFQRRFSSLPLSAIKITSEFWANWQRVVIDQSLPHQWEQLESTGRLDHFRIAAGQKDGEFVGFLFNDSDLYKWLEAAAYALAIQPRNSKLRAQVDEGIKLISAAQMDDGYLNTYFQIKYPTLRWANLGAMHEMYCAGHLIEAGVALYECDNDDRLMQIGIRFADHIMATFSPDGRKGYCGHEELEYALIRLARATGQDKYREYARWQIEMRGTSPHIFAAELQDPESMSVVPWAGTLLAQKGEYTGEYAQDHRPIREQTQVVGHAVRAMYFLTAAADLADGQNDEPLESAIKSMWDSLVLRRMYLTGGIGPSAHNEGFTVDYDLPNLSAYAETCASIGLIFWGQRLLEQTGTSDYADVIEKALYNGALSGISADGKAFFYDNPLESRGTHERKPWFDCACCPPNIARLITQLGQLAVGESEDSFYVHQFVGAEIRTEWKGVPVELKITTQFPLDGTIEIAIHPEKPVDFRLLIRIPEFTDTVEIDLVGHEEPADFEDGYAVYDRTWRPGDRLKIDLLLEPQWVQSDPRIIDNLGRVALMVGPVVYCMEGKEGGLSPQRFSADTGAEIAREKPTVCVVEGYADSAASEDGLYPVYGALTSQATVARFTPYYDWGNRGPVNMQVWVRQAAMLIS